MFPQYVLQEGVSLSLKYFMEFARIWTIIAGKFFLNFEYIPLSRNFLPAVILLSGQLEIKGMECNMQLQPTLGNNSVTFFTTMNIQVACTVHIPILKC